VCCGNRPAVRPAVRRGFVASAQHASTVAPAPVVAPELPAALSPIGCILPLTGSNAAYGNSALDAVLLAAGVFDAAKKTPIRLLIEDSRSEPAVAKAAVENLPGRGHLHPRTAGKHGSPRGRQRGPAPGRAHPDPDTAEGITGIGDHVFRNFLTPAMQVRTVVHYAQADIGLRRFALFYPEDPYGREMARLFKEEV